MKNINENIILSKILDSSQLDIISQSKELGFNDKDIQNFIFDSDFLCEYIGSREMKPYSSYLPSVNIILMNIPFKPSMDSKTCNLIQIQETRFPIIIYTIIIEKLVSEIISNDPILNELIPNIYILSNGHFNSSHLYKHIQIYLIQMNIIKKPIVFTKLNEKDDEYLIRILNIIMSKLKIISFQGRNDFIKKLHIIQTYINHNDLIIFEQLNIIFPFIDLYFSNELNKKHKIKKNLIENSIQPDFDIEEYIFLMLINKNINIISWNSDIINNRKKVVYNEYQYELNNTMYLFKYCLFGISPNCIRVITPYNTILNKSFVNSEDMFVNNINSNKEFDVYSQSTIKLYIAQIDYKIFRVWVVYIKSSFEIEVLNFFDL